MADQKGTQLPVLGALSADDLVIMVNDPGGAAVTVSAPITVFDARYQFQGAVLDDLNTLGANTADSEFLVGTGAGALAWESGATVRTSMGVGTGDTPTFTGLVLGGIVGVDIGDNTDSTFNLITVDQLSSTPTLNWNSADDGFEFSGQAFTGENFGVGTTDPDTVASATGLNGVNLKTFAADPLGNARFILEGDTSASFAFSHANAAADEKVIFFFTRLGTTRIRTLTDALVLAKDAMTLWDHATGNVGFYPIAGSASTQLPEAQVHIIQTEAATAEPALKVEQLNSSEYALEVISDEADTAVIVNIASLALNSSGTPAADFGPGIRLSGKSSTTDDQNMARLTTQWITATHASRASRGDLSSYFTTTERTAISWGSNSSEALLAFFDVTLAVQQSHIADPSGGATQDAEARTAINSILSVLETFGLTATS